MDRLTSMNVFVRTADLGSFAAAAEALRISPQMVAKHIARLESRLGTALINRTTRRQHLTDIGRSYMASRWGRKMCCVKKSGRDDWCRCYRITTGLHDLCMC